jgi:hypothetical protein
VVDLEQQITKSFNNSPQKQDNEEMKLVELDNQKTPNSSDSVESVTLFLVNMPRLFLSR